jgi:hypothetical protein
MSSNDAEPECSHPYVEYTSVYISIRQYRHRANCAVEGWKCKLNSFIRRQQLKGFLQVQKLKEETTEIAVTWDNLVKNEKKNMQNNKGKLNNYGRIR